MARDLCSGMGKSKDFSERKSFCMRFLPSGLTLLKNGVIENFTELAENTTLQGGYFSLRIEAYTWQKSRVYDT
jgi:hypothetical protein